MPSGIDPLRAPGSFAAQVEQDLRRLLRERGTVLLLLIERNPKLCRDVKARLQYGRSPRQSARRKVICSAFSRRKSIASASGLRHGASDGARSNAAILKRARFSSIRACISGAIAIIVSAFAAKTRSLISVRRGARIFVSRRTWVRSERQSDLPLNFHPATTGAGI